MTSAARRFRLGALLAAGALAVHELRYALGYGGHAGREAALQGHAYLSWAVPVVLLGALFAAAHLVLRVAAREAPEARGRRLLRLWIGCTLTLAVAYCAQELVEGWLAAGHPAGIEGVLGHGGWIALACAPVVGAAIALAVRGAVAMAEGVLATGAWRRVPLAPALLASAAPDFHPAADPVAQFLAGRGPPSVSV